MPEHQFIGKVLCCLRRSVYADDHALLVAACHHVYRELQYSSEPHPVCGIAS